MYREYFGLKEKPFSIAPNPHYFYMSEGHREALAHLLYGIKGEGGFVLLTGEVGAGKTTVCRLLLELIPEDLEIAFILNPPLTVEELVATVCDEFKISYPSDTRSVKDFVARIHAYLIDVHARSRRAVLIIEEAQNLSTEVLEQIRLLTNLETDEHKLLQIIMLGQPELRDKLKQPQLRQLSQRITARYHLGPLSKKETSEYVNYRLSTAGLVRPHRLFPERTLRKLFRLTRGVPRLINVICDRALLGTYVEGKDRVDTKTLTTAAREVSGDGDYRWRSRKIHPGITVCFLLVLCTAVAATHYLLRPEPLARVTVKTVAEGRGTEANATSVKGATVEKPTDTTRIGTRETAYGTLFKQWQIEYKPESGRTVCEQAVGQGLRCQEGGGGSISSLRQTNRPAVLRLLDEKNGEYYAALTALHGETTTVVIAADTKVLDVKEITPPWTGDYLVLWRAPSDYREKLKPGRVGPPVAWLDRQLALVQARTARTGREQVYDEEMVKQVKEFQRAAGLTQDGIAGLRTIMALTAAAGDGGPTLHDGKASN
jgi:general secretion pathway protein A